MHLLKLINNDEYEFAFIILNNKAEIAEFIQKFIIENNYSDKYV